MICRGCGKKLKVNENICPACGFYNEIKRDSLENDSFREMDYFEDPRMNNYSDDIVLDDNDDDIKDIPFDDEPVPEDNDQDDIDDLLKEKILGKKPEKEDKKSKKKQNDTSQYIDTDDSADFIAAFIGEDYKWIVNKPINIYALLFSWMYFVYRKLYIIGILGLTFVGIIYVIMPALVPIAIILSMVLSAVLFNPIYLMIVKIRVQRIVDQYGDESDSFILEKCMQKGGVNTPIALLVFFIFLVMLFLSHFNFTFKANPSKYWKDNTENEANCLSLGRKTYSALTERDSKEMIDSSLEEVACDIVLSGVKSYDIYLKLSSSGETRIVYFENKDGETTLRGDTKLIKTLTEAEKQGPLLDEDKEFLDNSQVLSSKFAEIKNLSNSEAQMEKNNNLKGQRTHYVFSKDEVYKKQTRNQ